MRFFRDGVCYVDFKDIAKRDLTRFVEFEDGKNYTVEDLVVVKNEEGIKVIMDRKDIVDFDEVSKMSDEELSEKIDGVAKDLNPMASRWIHTGSCKRAALYKDKNYIQDFSKLKEYYFDLIDYKNNRMTIDERINSYIRKLEKGKRIGGYHG